MQFIVKWCSHTKQENQSKQERLRREEKVELKKALTTGAKFVSLLRRTKRLKTDYNTFRKRIRDSENRKTCYH